VVKHGEKHQLRS